MLTLLIINACIYINDIFLDEAAYVWDSLADPPDQSPLRGREEDFWATLGITTKFLSVFPLRVRSKLQYQIRLNQGNGWSWQLQKNHI